MNILTIKNRTLDYIMGFIAGFLIMFAIWACTNPLQAEVIDEITTSNTGKYQMTMNFVNNSDAPNATSSYFYLAILDTETGEYTKGKVSVYDW